MYSKVSITLTVVCAVGAILMRRRNKNDYRARSCSIGCIYSIVHHCTFLILHCIVSHYTTPRYTTLHYTTLHYTTQIHIFLSGTQVQVHHLLKFIHPFIHILIHTSIRFSILLFSLLLL